MASVLQPDLIGEGTSTVSRFSGKIKSIQRGVATGAASSSGTAEVTISEVDPTKCAVYIKYGKGTSSFSTTYGYSYLTSLTQTKLSVSGACHFVSSNYQSSYFSWQVVEYD